MVIDNDIKVGREVDLILGEMMKEFEIGTIYKLNREYFNVLMAFDRNWKGHDSDIPHYVSIKKVGSVNLHFEEYGEGFTEWYYKTDLQMQIKRFTSILEEYPMLIEKVSKEDVFKNTLTDLSKYIDVVGYPPMRVLKGIEELDKEVDTSDIFEDIIKEIKSKIKLTPYSIKEWDYFIRLFGEGDFDFDDYTVQKAKILLSK